MKAAINGSQRCLELLLRAGASVDDADPNGYTALIRAAHAGHSHCLALLLQHSADPNVRAASDNYSALHHALLMQHHQCVERCVQCGRVDVNLHGGVVCDRLLLNAFGT